MTKFRTRSVLTLVAVSALSLTGCEKPSPTVTVTSATSSSHSQAICWSEAASIDATGCSEAQVAGALNNPDTPVVKILADQTVSISVDPMVAEYGWYPAIGGQRLSSKSITSTYYRFTFPQTDIPSTGYSMQVIAQSQSGGTRGVWIFKLVSE